MIKQTAVEWLIEHLLDNGVGIHKKVRETALELEQIQKMELLNESKGSDATSSQTEISDFEIDDAWQEFRIQNPNSVGVFQDQYLSFCFAIQWYREQLKNKQ